VLLGNARPVELHVSLRGRARLPSGRAVLPGCVRDSAQSWCAQVQVATRLLHLRAAVDQDLRRRRIKKVDPPTTTGVAPNVCTTEGVS
jgi:hypothetical protein